MECFLTLVLVFIIFVVVTRATAGGESRANRRRNFQLLARQHRGEYYSGGLFGSPAVRFRYGETLVLLTETAARGPYRGRSTQVQLNWIDARFEAEIFSVSPGTLSFTRPPAESKMGDADFERDFSVAANDSREARQLLTSSVRWQLQQLRQTLHDDRVYVEFYRGRLFIQKPQLVRNFAELVVFVERCLEFYDQALVTRAVGIQFLENDRAQTLEDVGCKICGERIEMEMVFCQRCKTPHHAECWHYTGACSVYGCRETSYIRPQMARKSRD